MRKGLPAIKADPETRLTGICSAAGLSARHSADRFGFKKVLIVALTGDPAMRMDLEQNIAGKLVGKGVYGISSRTLIPNVKEVNKDSLLELVKRESIDAVTM